MNIMLALGVFVGFSLNGLLQLGLGIRHIRRNITRPVRCFLFQWGIVFLSSMLLWFFFAYALNFFILSSLEWLLIFPLSALLCRFFEFCFSRFFPEIAGEARLFSARSAYDGLITALLLITLRAALSPLEAVALSLGFASGGFLAALILTAILRRSVIEAVPPSLRGTPLLFISMGLLSLVSASAAAALLRVFSFS